MYTAKRVWAKDESGRVWAQKRSNPNPARVKSSAPATAAPVKMSASIQSTDETRIRPFCVARPGTLLRVLTYQNSPGVASATRPPSKYADAAFSTTPDERGMHTQRTLAVMQIRRVRREIAVLLAQEREPTVHMSNLWPAESTYATMCGSTSPPADVSIVMLDTSAGVPSVPCASAARLCRSVIGRPSPVRVSERCVRAHTERVRRIRVAAGPLHVHKVASRSIQHRGRVVVRQRGEHLGGCPALALHAEVVDGAGALLLQHRCGAAAH